MSNEEMEKIEVGAENFKHPESDESVDSATEKAMEVINSESTNSLEKKVEYDGATESDKAEFVGVSREADDKIEILKAETQKELSELNDTTENPEKDSYEKANEKAINAYIEYTKTNNLKIDGLSQSVFIRSNIEMFGENGRKEDGEPKMNIDQILARKALDKFVNTEMENFEEQSIENGVNSYNEYLKISGESDDAFAFSNFVDAHPEMFAGEDPDFEKSILKKQIEKRVIENFKKKQIENKNSEE